MEQIHYIVSKILCSFNKVLTHINGQGFIKKSQAICDKFHILTIILLTVLDIPTPELCWIKMFLINLTDAMTLTEGNPICFMTHTGTWIQTMDLDVIQDF